MSTIEALKATWPSTYLLLVTHLVVATFVFRRKASKGLVEAGICSSVSEAARLSGLAYIASSAVVLALSNVALSSVFGVNEAFDIRLLPMYYQWLGRIILTPVSIVCNLFVLTYLTNASEESKRNQLLKIAAVPEKQLFLVNLFFAFFYV